MGNIHFEQSKFPQAIKMYRMALDQVPGTQKETRYKIMRNIGVAFMRLGQYQVSNAAPSVRWLPLPWSFFLTGKRGYMRNVAQGNTRYARKEYVVLFRSSVMVLKRTGQGLGDEPKLALESKKQLVPESLWCFNGLRKISSSSESYLQRTWIDFLPPGKAE
jgi:hypothetical protein